MKNCFDVMQQILLYKRKGPQSDFLFYAATFLTHFWGIYSSQYKNMLACHFSAQHKCCPYMQQFFAQYNPQFDIYGRRKRNFKI